MNSFRSLWQSRIDRRSPDEVRPADAASRRPRGRDEAGATLVLALLFLVVIGTIVGAIASWTSNDLKNTLVFQQERNVQSALLTATNVAIQNIRYTPLIETGQKDTLNANPPSYCWGSSSPSQTTAQGETVDVWCSTVWNPNSAQTRIVTISACLDNNGLDTAATCAMNPGLQTVVTFDDYSSGTPSVGGAACTPPTNGGTCGAGMTISSSLIGVSSPTVSGLFNPTGHTADTSGPTTGLGTLEVDGTGFVTGATSVNFVGTTASQNLVLNATSVNVTSSTTLTLTVPVATTVTTYNVVVTTPNGTSASSSSSQYTYNPVVPSITSVTTALGPATGSAAGGSTITVTGTGFLNNLAGDSTTVEFVDTTNANNVYTAPSSTVQVVTTGANTGIQLTAATPAISSLDYSYYVVIVTAPGGTSANGPVFTYQPLLPLVASVYAPASGGPSGGPGTSVTLTGVGFITSNTTVQLVQTSGSGSTLSLTGVSVSGSTTLTGTVPSGGTVNRAYYVEVTTPSGTSGSSGAPQFSYT